MLGEAGSALRAPDTEAHGSWRQGQVPSESVGPESSDLGAGSQDSGVRLCPGARVGMWTEYFREPRPQDRAKEEDRAWVAHGPGLVVLPHRLCAHLVAHLVSQASTCLSTN